MEGNVDLILATPPWERLNRFFKQLTKTLNRNEDQTMREFSLVLLGNLAAADTGVSRAIAITGNAIPPLISFVEETEHRAGTAQPDDGEVGDGLSNLAVGPPRRALQFLVLRRVLLDRSGGDCHVVAPTESHGFSIPLVTHRR